MPSGIYPRTKEHNKKVGLASKKRWKNPAYLKKMKERNKKISKLFKGKSKSEEHRKKLSEANKGKKNRMFGKHLSEKTKEKLRIAGLKRYNIYNKKERIKRFKERKKKGNLNYRKKYPIKIKAHQIANKYIKILKNQLCEKCLKELAKYKHHENYDKPLEVNFVCISCHKLIHKGE